MTKPPMLLIGLCILGLSQVGLAQEAEDDGRLLLAFPLLSSAAEVQTWDVSEPPVVSRYAWSFSLIGIHAPELFLVLANNADSVAGRVYGLIGMELFDVGNEKVRKEALKRVLRVWPEVTFFRGDFRSRVKIAELVAKVRTEPENWMVEFFYDEIPPLEETVALQIPVVRLDTLEPLRIQIDKINRDLEGKPEQ